MRLIICCLHKPWKLSGFYYFVHPGFIRGKESFQTPTFSCLTINNIASKELIDSVHSYCMNNILSSVFPLKPKTDVSQDNKVGATYLLQQPSVPFVSAYPPRNCHELDRHSPTFDHMFLLLDVCCQWSDACLCSPCDLLPSCGSSSVKIIEASITSNCASPVGMTEDSSLALWL